MIKTIRIMLLPNNKQETRMFEFANAARFAYNWAVERENENYKNGNKFIKYYDLSKEFNALKKTNDYAWLNRVSSRAVIGGVKNACRAYENFFDGYARYPKFKSKKCSLPQFWQSTGIKITNTHVKLEKISLSKKPNKQKLNWVKLAERNRIPSNSKIVDSTVKYDGLNWWLSVVIECPNNFNVPKNNGIGIDLGIKDLAICSDNNVYKNINKSSRIKKLKKKRNRLQRSISRKYKMNNDKDNYNKTNNIAKAEKELLKLNRKLANIRHDYIHKTTTKIIKREPSFICIEDLDVKGMMKNKYLSKSIYEQCFYEFRRQLEYKSNWNNIELIIANRFFPSSKLCSCCGNVKKDLKLSDRVYKCDCGNVIDRDYQAALNLKRYGENAISSVA